MNNNVPHGHISIQDIISIYIGLSSIPSPSEKLKQIKIKLEDVIQNFTNSLGATIQ